MKLNSKWIISEARIGDETFVVVNLYLKPDLNINQVMEEITQEINTCTENTEYPNIIVGGDLNGRVGELSYLEDDITEVSGCITNIRNSRDKVSNSRGRMIQLTMEELGLVLLNGRVKGDETGELTHVSEQGSSVIDLVYCNLTGITKVLCMNVEHGITGSDHFPITLQLQVDWNQEEEEDKEERDMNKSTYYKMKWKEDKKKQYEEETQEILRENFDKVNREDGIELTNLLKRTIKEVAFKEGMVERIIYPRMPRRNNWFNRECKEMKFKVRQQLRIWKRWRSNEEMRKYLDMKRKYKKMKETRKKEVREEMKNKIANVKNAAQFWEVIRKVKPMKDTNCISIENWEKHLRSTHECEDESRAKIELLLYDASREYFDKDITIEELARAMKKMKNKKAPGPDEVSNEFIKNLGTEGNDLILQLFNVTWEKEYVPEDWAVADLKMIYKKGEKKNPSNYRGIALLNCLTKLFTQILTNRFMEWMEKENLFCEGQAGFRRGRSCLDNIFVLMAMIQIHLRIAGNKIYAAMVDFRTAFDVINRDRLWQKLYNLGVSSKFIRVLQSLYSQTCCKIKINDAMSTSKVKVQKGLWQGDSFSAGAFAAYINDIEDYLRKKGYRGINIDGKTDIILLLFADDLIIFADSKIDLQKKLETLKEFCQENFLILNTDKTKIMIFRRGGRPRREDVFFFDSHPLEIVNTFTYLGVTFSSSGMYNVAAENMLTKTRLAMASVKHMFIKTKVDSWEARLKLYNAIIKATLMYGSEVWGLTQINVMEKGQNEFFKNLLYLARSTPGYMLRRETGVPWIKYHVISQALNWILKLEEMPPHKYPGICYRRLLELHERGVNCHRGNWVTQMSECIDDAGINPDRLWSGNIDYESKKKIVVEIAENMNKNLQQNDKERCVLSTYSTKYSQIKKDSEVENYLKCRAHIESLRLVAQARMAGRFIYFYVLNKAHYWKAENLCRNCDLITEETLEHFLIVCKRYDSLRRKHLTKISTHMTLVNMLCIGDVNHLYNLAAFLREALEMRKTE
ncbi:hypothetical protein M8J77_015968 [Diaphorina citri]|nr:hypothetical protein M8J77_015968 [Diaphorina citri]